MTLSIITLLSGLLLSLISAYYSISGLTAIFAAAVIPVIIMGAALEISKLVVTVWLKQYWKIASLPTKIYLTTSVIILMFITSIGCFGFLSKAHIEQVGQGQENSAQIQRITVELKRQADIVAKAEERAKTLETTGTGADANVNSQIRTEQGRIESALARVQPAIEEQQKIIDGQTKLYSDQVARIDEQLTQLQKFIDAKEVDKAQALVGAKPDGDWGSGTARAVTNWKAARATERTAAVVKLEEANRDPTIRAARDEILRIRKTVETQVSESNKLIDRLRNQLGKGDTASVESLVNEQQDKIKAANTEIETLTQKKYSLEAEYRKLEVEVGPIKYIAELIYDTTDQSILERAVRWVIILIVAVFDPLAVMMLLAATESMTWVRRALPKPPTPIKPPVPVKEKTLRYQPGIKKHRIRVWRRKRKDPVVPMPIVEEVEEDEDEDDPAESAIIKEAKKNWKADNPGETLKEQRRLHKQGLIDRLPWHDYLPAPEKEPVTEKVMFGQIWPDNPIKGFMFLRTDYLPSKLFKYNGTKWIEVDKSQSDSYAYNSAYIDYLVNKLASGEYDPELLSPAEQEQIELKLTQKG